MTTPITIISGDDESLVTEAVRAAVEAALGTEDRSLALEELTEEEYRTDDGFEIARLVDAAQTPPFLTGRRVVVGRHLGRFTNRDAVAPLVAYLESPLETTALVVVWEKGRTPTQPKLNPIPKDLVAAVAAAGGKVRKVGTGRGRDAERWLDERLDHASVDLDRPARALVARRMGEDRAKVLPLLETLEAVFGPGSGLGVADVEPFLGSGGNVAPWDLTDAIDKGDVPGALDCLARMLDAGGRHPLAVMASLNAHFGRLLRLDGSGVKDEAGSADALGIKGFPARKALQASRRLGPEKTARSIRLLASADLDLRGRSAWPPELVVEVLVARLASLARH
ncbi:MAG: DNA polymerase III subunit delta [Acidimicrobiales bacterium]|jgi:DNA polymerase-3 subunit delta|nr:DNA polymerase III subunit delta [Acidimicrobiales bacterium]|tara:strand:+ start:2885 stop:3898 length:1014 start_codon:yes stop_codon:yes gene_type:complete